MSIFCHKCGKELPDDSQYCTKCGITLITSNPKPEEKSTQIRNKRSNWWYLFPIILHIIGGVIAYFVIKNDDPRLAKNCLKLGLILLGIEIFIGMIAGISNV